MSRKKGVSHVCARGSASVCLLLHINNSTEAGRAKDKLILFTVVDQFIRPKMYICK